MTKLLIGLFMLASFSTFASNECKINLNKSDLTLGLGGYDVSVKDKDVYKDEIIDALYNKGYSFDNSSKQFIVLNNGWNVPCYHVLSLTFYEGREHGSQTLRTVEGKTSKTCLNSFQRSTHDIKLAKAAKRLLENIPSCN